MEVVEAISEIDLRAKFLASFLLAPHSNIAVIARKFGISESLQPFSSSQPLYLFQLIETTPSTRENLLRNGDV